MQLKSLLKSTVLLALTMPLNVLGKGRVSYYFPAPSKSEPPSCGDESKYLVDYYVSLSSHQLDQDKSYYCGKCVQIVYKNKYLVGRIVDRCPGCGDHGLDISPAMFSHFEDQDAGIFYADWNIVSCDLYGKKGTCPDSSCNISGSSSSSKPSTQASKSKTTTTTQTQKPATTQAPQQPKTSVPPSTQKPSATNASTVTPQNSVTTTDQQSTTTSVDGAATTTAESTASEAVKTESASAATDAAPVPGGVPKNSNPQVTEVYGEDNANGNGKYVIPLTGVVMVSCAAGAGLIYLTKSKKYETFPDALKGLKRSFTNGSSIRRNITRNYTMKRGDILPTTSTNIDTTGHVIDVNNEASPSEMDISESRVTFKL